MKKILLYLIGCVLLAGCRENREAVVKLETSQGVVRLKLYPETSIHRENFLKLVDEGYYNGMLFHRVIEDYMIQAGDPRSRKAHPGIRLGATGIGYTLKAEMLPQYFHKKGALAAARASDRVNPERQSDGSHFYIVKGSVFSPSGLDSLVELTNGKRFTALFERLQQARQGEILRLQAANDYEGLKRINEELSTETRKQFKRAELILTEEQREAYTTLGGIPHLDGEYTVFGEVIEGMEVVEKIARVQVDENFRPVRDIVIVQAKIEK